MTAFLLGIWALLLTPGPSNSLIALSGMKRGFCGSLRLLAAGLCACLLTVVPLALFGQRLFVAWPWSIVAAKLFASLWVLHLAVRHWGLDDPAAEPGTVRFKDLFITTLLNPKALVFGCVLLPGVPLQAGLPLFALSVVATAMLWMFAGALLGTRTLPAGTMLPRAVASWVALLSLGLAGSALG